jgi:predicted dehydrogenase
MNNITIGIVGAGEITRLVHMPVLKNIAGATVAWVADLDVQRVRTLSRAFDVKRQIILDGEINFPPCDIVLLATPVFARRPYIEYFGARGIAVLTEKPFAVSQHEHQQYLELCQNNQIHCGYMRRTYASVRTLRQMVQEGWFGKLREIRYSEGGRVTKSASSPKTLDMSYRMGGGVLMDLGCHGLDALLYITGANDFKVVSSNIEWDQDTDRQVVSEFILSGISGKENSESPVRFAVSWLTPQSHTIILEFDNVKVRAGITPERGLELQGTSKGGRWMSMSLDVYGALSSYQAFYLEWEEVLSSLRDGTEGEFAASSSLMTTRIVDAIYQWGGGK